MHFSIGDAAFLIAEIATARVYAARVLLRAWGLRTIVVDRADAVPAFDDFSGDGALTAVPPSLS